MHLNLDELKKENLDNGFILIHEHIFNLYPYWIKKENFEFTMKLLEDAHSKKVKVIVDLTAYSKIYNYLDIINATPIKIINCTGFYTGKLLPHKYKHCGEDVLIAKMNKDILVGRGKAKFKASIIKIATNNIILKDYEERIFKSAAEVSKSNDIPIVVHVPRNSLMHFKYLINNGANPNRVLIAHLEKGISKCGFEKFKDDAFYIMKCGGFIQLSEIRSKYKSEIIQFIKDTLDSKYHSQLLLSSDCNWKWKNKTPILKKIENIECKYTYIIDIFEELVKCKIFSEGDLNIIFRVNPINFLGIKQ